MLAAADHNGDSLSSIQLTCLLSTVLQSALFVLAETFTECLQLHRVLSAHQGTAESTALRQLRADFHLLHA